MPPPPLPARFLNRSAISKAKKRKPDPPEVIEARYARLGVIPPPKLTNQLRFKLFIERINRRQWSYLSNVVNPTLLFNGEKMTLYELTLLLKSQYLEPMRIAEMVGGRVFPNPPERDIKRFESDPLMARVVVTGADGGETARHLFVDFEDGKISGVWEMQEEVPRRRKRDMRKKFKTVGLPTRRRELEEGKVEDLEDWYREYIGVINSGAEAMREFLGAYCRESGVKRNGILLPIERYIGLMADVQEAVEGLTFEVTNVVADEERQMVAARIEFVGTPVKMYMGAAPTGDEVEWAEHVFYWLDAGKIAEVISIVDWEAYREGLGQ